MSDRRRIRVVGAVIVRGDRILCARRGPKAVLPGMWEFPGGKIEPNESPRKALEREIDEELDCVVAVGEELTTTTHSYDFAEVTLTTFWCELRLGTPTLREHSEMRWLQRSELESLQWAPADIPAVRKLAAGT